MRKRREVGHTFKRLNGLFWLETPDDVRDTLGVQSSTFSINSSQRRIYFVNKVGVQTPKCM